MNSPPSRFLYIHLNYRFIWFQAEYKAKRVNQESFKYYFLLNDKQKCVFVRKNMVFRWRKMFKLANSCDHFSRISFRWSFHLNSSQINSFFKQTCGDTIHVYFGSFVHCSTLYWTGFCSFRRERKKACHLLLFLFTLCMTTSLPADVS